MSPTTAPISSATTPASAATGSCSIRCRGCSTSPASGSSAPAARPRRRRSPPTSPRRPSRSRPRRKACSGWVPLPEAEMFDVEYWSLEQAKLAKQVEKPLSRQVAVVTGGASGLGLAVAKALRDEGAEVAVLDIAADAAAKAAKSIGALGLACDVTDASAVDRAVAEMVKAFGGVDILISNAGAAFQGALRDGLRRGVREGLRGQFLGAPLRRAGRGAGDGGAEAPAGRWSSTSPNRRSIRGRISGPTARRRRR